MFADELIGREAFEGLQSSPEVVGADEGVEVISQLVVIVVVEAFDGRVLDGAVPLPGNGLPANREYPYWSRMDFGPFSAISQE